MIKLEHITKKFGHITAVDHISFEVEKGEILGFLGPNAAGKSTTMRMITGFIPPSHGNISVAGYDVEKNQQKIKSLIGYLPESSPEYKDMTPHSFLKFAASIRGIKKQKAALERVIELCNLKPVLFQPIDTLSKGFTQRVCLAQALIHDPPILILDEPTDGLDPNQKHQTRELIKHMGKDKTIIISTHILEEIDACCSRVIIISNGKIVADNTPDNLRIQSDIANTIILEISNTESVDKAETLLGKLPFSAEVIPISNSKDCVKLRIKPNKIANITALTTDITKLIKKENWKIKNLSIDKGDLAQVFRKITRSGPFI